MNTPASAPSVTAATGSDQKVGLPYMPKAISGPSVRSRNSRSATTTADTWATSSTPTAATLRSVTSKLQPESAASSPMPSANCARKSTAKYRCSQRRAPSPSTKAPKMGSATTTHLRDSRRTIPRRGNAALSGGCHA